MPLLGLDFETLALSAEQVRLVTEVDLELWLVRHWNPVAQRLTGRTAADWDEKDIRELVGMRSSTFLEPLHQFDRR
jgi:hypothetical protein